MALDTEINIKNRADQIRNETAEGANTANRVGSWMRDAWDTLIDKIGTPITIQEIADALAGFIPLTQKASPNGVATLDENGKVPNAQLDIPIPNLQQVSTAGNSTTIPLQVNDRIGSYDYNTTIYPNYIDINNNVPSNPKTRIVAGGFTWFNSINSRLFIACDPLNNFIRTITFPHANGRVALQSEIEGAAFNLQIQINAINTLLQSNDVNLDNVQELVDSIKTVQTSLATILVNDLVTGGVTKALTSEQGKVLQDTKQNILVNYSDVDKHLLSGGEVKIDVGNSVLLAYNPLNNNPPSGEGYFEPRLSWILGKLYAFDGVSTTESADWQNRQLKNSNGNVTFDYENTKIPLGDYGIGWDFANWTIKIGAFQPNSLPIINFNNRNLIGRRMINSGGDLLDAIVVNLNWDVNQYRPATNEFESYLGIPKIIKEVPNADANNFLFFVGTDGALKVKSPSGTVTTIAPA